MMQKPRILVTMPRNDKHFVTDKVKEFLNSFAVVEYNSLDAQMTKEQMVSCLKDKDYALTGWGTPRFDAQMIKQLPHLKMIAHTGGSVGALIDPSVYDTDVLVASGNDYYAESVAEGTLCYIIMALRRILYFSKVVQDGGWSYEYDEGLFDRSVGIISLGAISTYLIKLLKPFRVKIYVSSTRHDDKLAHELGFEYASTEEIFKTCKIISVHTAMTPATRHLINRKLIESIPDGSIFINTSRGAVVDEQALADELKKNRFTAVLDVFEKEPLPNESPLRGLDNATLMPHKGGPTADRYEYITCKMVEDIRGHWQGLPVINEIKKEQGTRMTVLL